MGILGWGEKDTSTPQERDDWRSNAQKQMDEQNGKTDDDGDETPRHRRARNPR